MLISFLLGGFTSEVIVISTGNQNVPALFITVLAFIFLSGIVFYEKYKYYFFPDTKEQHREDILDD